MTIWLIGTHSAGKTTTAALVQQLIPGSGNRSRDADVHRTWRSVEPDHRTALPAACRGRRPGRDGHAEVVAPASTDAEQLAMDGMTEETDPNLAIDLAGHYLDEARDAAVDLYKLLHAAQQPTAHITSLEAGSTITDAQEG